VHTKHPGGNLVLCSFFTLVLLANVDLDQGLVLPSQYAVRAKFEAQRGWQALVVQITRLPVDDHGNNAITAAPELKLTNLFIDVFAFRGMPRADHDHGL
jgi:hypothetical protein